MVSGVVWPSIADIFCANSSSVHTHFRLPVMTKNNAQDIVEWGNKLHEDANSIDENETMASTPTNSVPGTTSGFSESGRMFRETRRKRRSRSLNTNKPIKHRRGVRRWSMLVDTKVTAESKGQSPAFIQQLLQWMVSSLQQLTDIHSVGDDNVFVDVLHQWQACTPAELVDYALASPPSTQTPYTPLTSLIWHIVHIMGRIVYATNGQKKNRKINKHCVFFN
jgi:hypothetical protein